MSEARIVVEYIIEMPDDIMVSQVDDFIKNEIDEGADSNNIKNRIVADVSFIDGAGIFDKYHIAKEALENIADVIRSEGDVETINLIVEGVSEMLCEDDDCEIHGKEEGDAKE